MNNKYVRHVLVDNSSDLLTTLLLIVVTVVFTSFRVHFLARGSKITLSKFS